MGMTKEQLIETLVRILDTDVDLSFLFELKERELETLVACVRDRIGNLMGRSDGTR